MISQFGRQYHGNLSSGIHQRVKIRIKFASYVLGTEHLLRETDEPQHQESLEETDDEAAHNQNIGTLRAGADAAQQKLQ